MIYDSQLNTQNNQKTTTLYISLDYLGVLSAYITNLCALVSMALKNTSILLSLLYIGVFIFISAISMLYLLLYFTTIKNTHTHKNLKKDAAQFKTLNFQVLLTPLPQKNYKTAIRQSNNTTS